MKRLFKFKRVGKNVSMPIPVQVKTYTAADVTADLTAKMLLLFEDIRECVEHKQGSAIRVELSRLNRLGLSNTANAEMLKKAEMQIAEYNKKVDTLKFMQHAWSKYGKDVMIVSYSHFMEILEKYDLVCGSLDRYTGAIPEDNLKEIDNLYKMHEKFKIDEKEALNFSTVQDISNYSFNDVSEFIKLARFPLRIDGVEADVYNQMGTKDLSLSMDASLTSTPNLLSRASLFRERMNERGEPIIEYIPDKTSPILTPKYPFKSQFFIAAPCEEMERIKFNFRVSFFGKDERISTMREFESLTKYCELVETKDPFICSCTPYGVMIHSKWGDEAQDEIIKRYEKLSETVNQNKAIE